MKTQIIYEDEALMVIHKPAGIAVQSARVGQMDVESELRNYLAVQGRMQSGSPNMHSSVGGGQKKPVFLGLIHRLDQPVEGLLVVAKQKEAAARLNKQLTEGSLNKKYLAVVQLPCEDIPTEGTFTDFLLKDGQTARIVSTKGKETSVSPAGKGRNGALASSRSTEVAKKAVLQYRILNRTEGAALVDIQIDTGRFHQIRCQMAYHGMPLLGDLKYGSSSSMELSTKLGIRQTALCADRIAFIHPFKGKELAFQTEPQNIAFSKFQ